MSSRHTHPSALNAPITAGVNTVTYQMAWQQCPHQITQLYTSSPCRVDISASTARLARWVGLALDHEKPYNLVKVYNVDSDEVRRIM